MAGVVADGAIDPTERLYLSPSTRSREDDSDLRIEAVAITAAPAQILMEPISVYPGLDRWQDWRDGVEPRQRRLLERAAEGHRHRGCSEPLTVHDADAARTERRERELERRGVLGPLRYGRAGPILSAR